MGQQEQQHVGGAMAAQVVGDGVDPRDLRGSQLSTFSRKATQ
ncbi:hypothetical protein [Methylobacterium nodulans]|nr:hypothetical protein [Methylobacterium nodulans]